MGSLLHLVFRSRLIFMLVTLLISWSAVQARPLGTWQTPRKVIMALEEQDDDYEYGSGVNDDDDDDGDDDDDDDDGDDDSDAL